MATDSTRWSGSWPDGSARRTAISMACRWTAGSAARSASETSVNRSVRPPSASPRSDSAGAERRTRTPSARARSTAARQIEVFPIPASPSTMRLARPERPSSRNRSTASSSAARPITSGVMGLGPRSGPETPSSPTRLVYGRPEETPAPSPAWTMRSNRRHRIATRSADPKKPNQKGAVIPSVWASRPPIGAPMTRPPTIATR